MEGLRELSKKMEEVSAEELYELSSLIEPEWGVLRACVWGLAISRPSVLEECLDISFALGRKYEQEHAKKSVEFIVREEEP